MEKGLMWKIAWGEENVAIKLRERRYNTLDDMMSDAIEVEVDRIREDQT
jgi:hypothetical protein